jgi:hypothetical protein
LINPAPKTLATTPEPNIPIFFMILFFSKIRV